VTNRVLDFALRLAFFAAAPFLVVFAAALFPVTGAVAQLALALAVFFVAEQVRGLAARSRVVRLVASGQLEFEEYYRAHPPRPFLYYVFYPVLFPYWLTVREARREFLLYKGYTLLTFLWLVGSLVFQYFRAFPPELGLKAFVPLAVGSFVVEGVVVLMFLMPIVTSVVHFHTNQAPRRLAALLVTGFLSMGAALARIEARRDPVVSYATRTRVRLRTAARPALANDTLVKGLRAAWAALPSNKADVDIDGKVEGTPLEQAHAAMTGFFRNDEAYSFDLWYTKRGKEQILVIYFEARRGKPPIWLAMDGSRAVIHDVKRLPRGALAAMDRATQ
jgi:hypothetical protein